MPPQTRSYKRVVSSRQNQSIKSTKAESYSGEILEPTQSSLNEAHLRHRWLLEKSWMLLQDYQFVVDMQLMQYLLTPR